MYRRKTTSRKQAVMPAVWVMVASVLMLALAFANGYSYKSPSRISNFFWSMQVASFFGYIIGLIIGFNGLTNMLNGFTEGDAVCAVIALMVCGFIMMVVMSNAGAYAYKKKNSAHDVANKP
jgi:uncharacterized membrane protein